MLSMSQILAIPFPRNIPAGRHGCREVQGFSLCAGEALAIKDTEPWCPVRMCAPKHVPAEACPAEEMLKATAHCELKVFKRDYYKCDGQKYGLAYLPEGCDPKKDENCESVKSCSCYKVENEYIPQLRDAVKFEGICEYPQEQ